MRICEACKREGEPVNHNGRGLRCPYCWEKVPTPPSAADGGEPVEAPAAESEPVEAVGAVATKRKKK